MGISVNLKYAAWQNFKGQFIAMPLAFDACTKKIKLQAGHNCQSMTVWEHALIHAIMGKNTT